MIKNKIETLLLKRFPNASNKVIENQKAEADLGLFAGAIGTNEKFDFVAYENYLDTFDSLEEFEQHLRDTSDDFE